MGISRHPGHAFQRRFSGRVCIALGAVAAAWLVGGCAQNELGTKTGYYWPSIILKDSKRIRNVIISSEDYWVQKDPAPQEEFPGPTPADLEPPKEDYILGPGDLVDITILDLVQPGQPYPMRDRISQTGMISLQYLGAIKAAGLTARGLENKLIDLLAGKFIRNPQVTVFVSDFRNLNVAVLNGFAQEGLYPLQKQDTTLLELIAMAHGLIQLTEEDGYIIRKYTPDEVQMLMLEQGMAPPNEGAGPATGPAGGGALTSPPPEIAPKAGEKPPEKAPPGGEPIPPPAKAAPTTEPTPGAKAGPAKNPAIAAKEAQDLLLQKMAEGDTLPVKKIEAAEAAGTATPPAPFVPAPAETAPPPKDKEELGNWIWSDGKWVQVKPKTGPGAETPPAVTAVPPEVQPMPPVAKVNEPKTGTAETVAVAPTVPETAAAARLKLEKKMKELGVIQGAGQLRRIIRFNVKALLAGDLTQNVVLRDGDVVTIPSPQLGDFYMAGEVARPGVYSLTGRKITVLQAIVAAGGLTAVAVPWRTEIVRRVSATEEEIIYTDIGKIARGEVPDFYLQPEDIIRVGTDQMAIFNAVFRNAFRATYGLGGVYDMNFADFFPMFAARHAIFP